MGAVWLDLGEYRGPGRSHAVMGYMVQRRKERAIEQAYRIYVTDSLRAIPQGQYIKGRFFDLTREHEDIDEKAIVAHVVSKVRGVEDGDIT